MKPIFIQDPAELAAQWPRLKGFFQRVTDEAAKGEFTVDDLYRLAQEEKAVIGYADDYSMAIAFEFIHYPQFVAVNVMALCGVDLKAVSAEFFERFREFCRLAGARCIEASCSPAMARLLRSHGFEETYRLVRNKL